MEGIKKVQNVKISSSVITIENGAFKGISPNATISVSAKSKKKYKATVKLIKESGVSDTVKFKRVK